MRRDLTRSAIVLIASTILLGLVYPLAVTGIAQVAFRDKANGSLIREDGKVVGSRLLARDYSRPTLGADGTPSRAADGSVATEPDPRYFQPRPSATGYSATVTYFPNRGPNQRSTRDLTRQHLSAYLALERRYSPGLRASQVPVDAVTFSASGVDPQISRANAAIQARRVAAVRRLSPSRVDALIDANTAGRALGVFGEPGVNVVTLNLALDRESR
jgi:K+-transporting ATPase ATPase C chain